MGKLKIKLTHVCPACGSTEIQKLSWSGEVGPEEDEDFYSGPWMECLDCALQGPKLCWDKMARRRLDIQAALSAYRPGKVCLGRASPGKARQG